MRILGSNNVVSGNGRLHRPFRVTNLAACVGACLIGAGLTTHNVWSQILPPSTASATNSPSGVSTQRYIVLYSEPPLALHNRSVKARQGTSAQAKSLSSASLIPFSVKANGRAYLDTRSSQATSYVATLNSLQVQHRQTIEKTLARAVKVGRTYQYALNGMSMELTPQEAQAVSKIPGVASIRPIQSKHTTDDVSSRFIGADKIWRGSARNLLPGYTYPTLQSLFGDLNSSLGYKGDGIVIGVMDTGYNSLSPSYAATDDSGYTITNPLGSGKYLGDCGVANISAGGCNDKVIAVYDEYSRADKLPSVNVDDLNSHGSHTSSTAGGNARNGGFPGFTANFSGIAPHANLAIFAITPPYKSGSTVNDSELSAVEDIIKDGIVDVINLSFGGCSEPDYWSDPTSLAFLSAMEANIFTAQSAGNTQPADRCSRQAAQTPGTVANNLPWVTTVAATSDPFNAAAAGLAITGPGTPPAPLTFVPMTEGTFDTPLATPFPGTTPIVLSPQFNASDLTGNDGCTAFPAHIFDNSIALVSRGTCGFAVKVPNAIAAGAIAVVIVDNRLEGTFSPTVGPPTVAVPVYSVLQSDGLALQKFLKSLNGPGTASLGLYQSTRPTTQADVLANFSLIGPVASPFAFDVIKPDVAAPGVDILAAFSNAKASFNSENDTDPSTNYDPTTLQITPSDADIVGFDSGTSMASPHIAGAAALVMGVHRDWTAAEVRSALMMTAAENGLTKADGKTPTNFYDRGAGRIQVDKAVNAGLVLDESGDNFIAANPGKGGDPSSLNLASFQKSSCAVSCTFTRTFRSTLSNNTHWITDATGELKDKITIAPARFAVPAGGKMTLTFTVDTSRLTPNASFHFGDVQLAQDADLPVYTSPALHLPLAVAVPAPTLLTSATTVNIPLNGQPNGSASVSLSNPGVGTMLFKTQTGGSVPLTPMNQPALFQTGYASNHIVGGNGDAYAADDLTVPDLLLTHISVDGFVNDGGQKLTDFGSSLPLHWRIYADNNGVPSGNPDSNDNAVWKYDATAGSSGVSVAGPFGSSIGLDLPAANLDAKLPGGHYWLVVYPDLPCEADNNGNCTFQWNWFTSNAGNTTLPVQIQPQANSSAWTVPGDLKQTGLAATIIANASCSLPSWLSLTPNNGAVASASSATLKFVATAAGYAPQTSVSALVCLNTGYQSDLGLTIPQAVIPILVNATN